MIKRITLSIFLIFCSFRIIAQINAYQLQQFLGNEANLESFSFRYTSQIEEFYKLMQFQPVWIYEKLRREELQKAISQASGLGLDIKDYQEKIAAFFSDKKNIPGKTEDSVAAEISFTDAAIHFLHDIKYGNNSPSLRYNGLDYSPGCANIPFLLAAIIRNNQLSFLPGSAGATTPDYISIRNLITRYNRVIADSSFKEVTVISNKVSDSNRPLLIKLCQLGLIDSADQQLADSTIKEKIKTAQRLFNLLADGVLRSTAIEAINVPMTIRLRELKQALNTIRWLSCIREQQKIIVVNIPSATLLVYDKDTVILESRIIAGKRSTPTPTLCSKVSEVIFYPYWMVPYSIATKELLPSIKRNISFLDAGNYQVINQQGKVIDPSTIDWSSLSASNFPYIIRQSTGCDNALGLIKLNFYNPFSVYLHDTPTKNLFSMNKRYFSHGCMRVEKAMELGRIILKNNAVAIDTLEEKGCLYNQSPVVVPADENLPVFVLYNTAWVDASGKVSFHEDIYRRNK